MVWPNHDFPEPPGFKIECADNTGDWIDNEASAAAEMSSFEDKWHKNVDCTANAMHGLSFLSSGDGGAGAGWLCVVFLDF